MNAAIAYENLNNPFYGLFGPDDTDIGCSQESKQLKTVIKETSNHLREPFYRQSRYISLFDELRETLEDCAEDGWDGYDASKIDEDIIDDVLKFINLLPTNLSLPEIIPEPGGEIAFEWYKDKWHVFTASISAHGIINYAGLFGPGRKAYGTEYFTDSVPAIIIQNIKRLNLNIID